MLVEALLSADYDGLCLLDSCGTAFVGSKLLVAGVAPVRSFQLTDAEAVPTLDAIDDILTSDRAAIFTLSYDLGRKINSMQGTDRQFAEPDLFVSQFETLLIHDYDNGETRLAGSDLGRARYLEIIDFDGARAGYDIDTGKIEIFSNFTRAEYLTAIEKIKEQIRAGNTYQTNLTQQLTVHAQSKIDTRAVFRRLRRHHPAPFLAYIRRPDSTVVSASPERFFRVIDNSIEASPIKGTRPRGADPIEDERWLNDLLRSEKDRAENTMIVDLLRNDLGRVCAYGSVRVAELCAVQSLPTLFHLVSTINGSVKPKTKPSDLLRALFPCGSITGAPKISTMRIIDELERIPRGLSMGAIGLYIPDGFGLLPMLDLSVAIRTMVVRDNIAAFNVGGGIVIDSDPASEYQESLIKARALLASLGVEQVPSF
jgi:para-aminobenzoate synthetase component 1